MNDRTTIEWCDATWNPTRGCSRVSEGCRNCYAERVAARFSNHHPRGRPDVTLPGTFATFARNTPEGPRWTGRVELVPKLLDWPLRRRKPLRIFVNSMSDLFHDGLTFDVVAAVYAVMQACPLHTFLVLTKRPERAAAFSKWLAERGGVCDWIRGDGRDTLRPLFSQVSHWDAAPGRKPHRAADDPWMRVFSAAGCPVDDPLPNVWLGVSVEDQATADARIPELLSTPAAVRFVSYEPALEPVDFTRIAINWKGKSAPGDQTHASALFDHAGATARLDQIIVGGESGHGARPMDLAWVRSTVAQCKAAGVACFVKQLGARPFEQHPFKAPGNRWYLGSNQKTGDLSKRRLKSPKGGDMAEWPEDLRVREFPATERVA